MNDSTTLLNVRAFALLLGAFLLGMPQAPAQPSAGNPASAQAEDAGPPQIPGVKWILGPSEASMGTLARIQVPKGYVFADGESTRKLMEVMQNFPSPSMKGLVGTPDLNWFVVFDFEDIGYVKDDEKDTLDADKMLKAMKANDEAANEERRKRGWDEMHTGGWVKPPFYNEETKRIEWGIRIDAKNGSSVNYRSKILGRSGVMEAVLVTDPEMLEPTLPTFTNLLTGYEFQSGQRYAEYKQGDKLAAVGLTALVVGGGAAVAMKMGLLQKFWKVIVVGVIAIGAFFKKIFGSLFGRRDAA